MANHFLQGIDTIIIRVSNIARALALKAIHEDEKLRLVVLDTFSPTSLTLWETDEKIQSNPRATTYPIFRTMDASYAHELLRTRNVDVGELTTDHMVTYFTFQDPDGNVLEACQLHN